MLSVWYALSLLVPMTTSQSVRPCYYLPFLPVKRLSWDLNPSLTIKSVLFSTEMGIDCTCIKYVSEQINEWWSKHSWRASLVAQWLRIRLPMQGTRVWSLVWEDPTCHGGTKPVRHSYWACALQPASHNYLAYVPQLLKPTLLEPMLRNQRSHCNEKPAHCNEE